ncbi:MAG: response regulator [Actinomycetota bacterium]
MLTARTETVEIAYVDDSEDDQLLASIALQELNLPHELTIAESAIELWSLLRARIEGGLPLPSVLVLDLKMPKVNGHQLLAQLALDPELSGIPVVILSTSADVGDQAAARENGAVRYEVKPSSFSGLVEVFARIAALGRQR